MSPKIRESLYYLGTIVPGVIGIALIWGGIDAGAAESIGDILVGLLSLIGASAPAVAAKKVNEQRKDGTFEDADPASVVQQVIEKAVQAQSDLDRVKNAVAGAVGQAPVLGPLAAQLVNAVPTSLGQAYTQWNNSDWYKRPEDR